MPAVTITLRAARRIRANGRQSHGKRERRRIFSWAVPAVVALAGLMAFAVARPVTVAPRLRPAPPFALVDHEGRTVTHRDLLGAPVLYGFFPADPGDPLALAAVDTLCELGRQLEVALRTGAGSPVSGLPLQFVTITVAPERDTPARLAAFMKQTGPLPGWRWLTGSAVAVKVTVGTGFGVYYADPPGDGEPARPYYEPRFALVDGRGLIRAEYPGPRLDARRVMRDLELVRREEQATGMARLVYEAAHRFLCYPR